MTEFVLVSCSKSKRDGVHLGRDLYEPSPIFRKRRKFAQRRGDAWGVLSAKHGYIADNEAVEDYERHISDRTPVWGAFVLRDLLEDLRFHDVDQVTVLAGSRYVEPLVVALEARGYDVVDWNAGKRPGERMSALDEANEPTEQQPLITDGGLEGVATALLAKNLETVTPYRLLTGTPRWLQTRNRIDAHRDGELPPVRMGCNPEFLYAAGERKRKMIHGPPRRPLDDGDPCPECGHPFDAEEWDERHLCGGPSIGEDWLYTCPNCDQETCEVGT